jgi:hypothetical protein
VAKGFRQREGIYYNETFSPVSCKDSIRIIMALVAHFDLELHQMDVKTDISKWGFRRKGLHETTQGFYHGRQGRYGMPPKEIHIWIKASL